MSENKPVGFCIECSYQIDSWEGLKGCPNCASTSVPCSADAQVNISINWQELRVLCMWAERWGLEKVGGAGTVYSIAERILKQVQDEWPNASLTLAQDIGQVKDHFGHDNVSTNFPGVE